MGVYMVFVRKNTKSLELLAEYANVAKDAPFGAMRVLASKAGWLEVLEGDPVDTVVLMRFPSREEAMAWYQSDVYVEARKIRQAAAEFNVFMMEETAPLSA